MKDIKMRRVGRPTIKERIELIKDTEIVQIDQAGLDGYPPPHIKALEQREVWTDQCRQLVLAMTAHGDEAIATIIDLMRTGKENTRLKAASLIFEYIPRNILADAFKDRLNINSETTNIVIPGMNYKMLRKKKQDTDEDV